MNRRVAVLRPEPGNAATCARAVALGFDTISLPLFEVVALPWSPPDPADHDALLLTSANAARLAGGGLRRVAQLPLLAVGEATAAAAHVAGMEPAITGVLGASALIEQAADRGFARLLHLGGRDTTIAVGGIVRRSIAVYASIARPVDPAALAMLAGSVALVHSARAVETLATLVDAASINRRTITLVTISTQVAQASGAGWAEIAIAPAPNDRAMLETAAALLAD